MKSTMTRMYDYRQSVVPEELLRWRIQKEEIDRQLELLSRNHAILEDVCEVRRFDAVKCRGASRTERWNRPDLLFFPGRGLCSAALENACLGMKTGETRTAAAEEGEEVTLTVERIVRQSPMPVCDDLIRAENIPGIETLDAYSVWFRETNEPERREEAISRTAYFLLEQVAANSEFAFDEAERDSWSLNKAKVLYDALLAGGEDPKIPKEGTVFLTEEEAIARLQEDMKAGFPLYVSSGYLLEKVWGRSLARVYQEGLVRLTEDLTLPDEVTDPVGYLEAQSGKAILSERVYMEAVLDQLRPYAKTLVEE